MVKDGFRGKVKTFEGLNSYFIMNKKATIASINKCNQYFNDCLPTDYRTFLENYNGGILFKVEDIAGYELLGVEKLILANKFQKENFGDDWDNSIILFCNYIGEAIYLGFRIIDESTYEIVQCIMDQYPENWKTIYTRFNDLISKLLEEGGREFWHDKHSTRGL